MPGTNVTPSGRRPASCSAPATVSWSVRAKTSIPAALAFSASRSGVSVPSDAVECICRSIRLDISPDLPQCADQIAERLGYDLAGPVQAIGPHREP